METAGKSASTTGGCNNFRESARNFATAANTNPKYTVELSVPASATANKMYPTITKSAFPRSSHRQVAPLVSYPSRYSRGGACPALLGCACLVAQPSLAVPFDFSNTSRSTPSRSHKAIPHPVATRSSTPAAPPASSSHSSNPTREFCPYSAAPPPHRPSTRDLRPQIQTSPCCDRAPRIQPPTPQSLSP